MKTLIISNSMKAYKSIIITAMAMLLISNASAQFSGGTGRGDIVATSNSNVPLTDIIEVTATSGTTAAIYSTIKAAFDAINAGTHQGDVTIKMNGSTIETICAVLNASGTGSANYSTVVIYPSTAGLSVSGNLATPLLDLNGADNVTIDGRVNRAGSTSSLIVSNTNTSSTAGTSTMRFINDATSNTVKYCYLMGSSLTTVSAQGGTILFSTSTGATGNDGNTINYNYITNAGGRPDKSIQSFGTSGKENSGNTISNNNFADFMNLGISVVVTGIHIYSNSTDFTISGNSFYETAASYAATGTAEIDLIRIDNTSGNNFTISGNFIGGRDATCIGTLTKTGTSNNFYGIYISAGTTTASNIQGNTLNGISWTNTGNASFYGIYVAAGSVNIGNTTANTLGSTSTATLKLTNTTAGGSFYGIYSAGTGIKTISGNLIGAISAMNSTPANNTNFYGIYTTGSGTNTISRNTIGSTSTASSINLSSASTGNPQMGYGIYIGSSGTNSVTGDTIANIVNSTSNSTATTTGLISGIYITNGTCTVQNNTINDLIISNANNTSTETASVTGIVMLNTTAAAQDVSGNKIYNLSNTFNTSPFFVGNIIGIYYSGPVTASSVYKNFIHSLSVTGASSTAASLYGIKINSGLTTYYNNIIFLGGNTKTTLYGFYETGVAGNNNSIYLNTVYLNGTLASGSTNKSYALYSAVTTNSRDFRNNIFFNARITTSGSSLHYSLYIVTAGGTLNCNYNDYYVTGTGGILGYYGVNAAALPIVTGVTGNDANSLNTNPIFVSAGTTTAANYKPGALMQGVSGLGITTDYSGSSRPANPTIGALEVLQITITASLGTTTGAYSTLQAAFTAINAGTHNGVITIKINGNTTETAAATLYQSGYTTSSYTYIGIFPTSTGLTISGNLATPLIDLWNADNVCIDGRVNRTGNADLTISNTSTSSTAGTSTIRFINDATTDTVRYCYIKGSSTVTNIAAGGTILFSTAITTGNDNNIIEYNNITNAGSRPYSSMQFLGTSTKDNNGIIVRNNNFYDILNLTGSVITTGIHVYNYNNSITILNNNFYGTTSYAPIGLGTAYSIYLNNASGNSFNVSGNYIGGSSASCTGMLTKTAEFSNPSYGIYVNAGSTTATEIQGNTIKNISWSNSTNASFYGIYVAAGLVNVGTTIANTIGASTGTGSITLTNATTGGGFYGIYVNSTSAVSISANVIGSVTTANASVNNTDFYGIYSSNSAARTITNNVIGSATESNSINLSSASTGTAQLCYGIYINSGSTNTITGNILANLTNSTTNTGTSTYGITNGIYLASGANTVQTNIIRNLKNSNLNTNGTNTPSVSGIVLLNTSQAVAHDISSNTIYNLSNDNASFTGSIIGLDFTAYSIENNIYKNVINGFSVNSSSSNNYLVGMKISGSSTVAKIYNNMISIGCNTASNIYGIEDNTATGGSAASNIFFNSVYIYGNPTTGTASSMAFYFSGSTTIARQIKNNMFINVRSNSGSKAATGTHYAVYLSAKTGLTINYNDYYSSGTGGVLGYLTTNKSTISDWKSATTQDANSSSKAVTFISETNLRVSGASIGDGALTGTPVSGITSDIDNTSRSISFPYMGTSEGNTPLAVALASFTAGVQDRNINLKWQTSSEIDNYGFDVERTVNRQQGTGNWEKIGHVTGKGTTNTPTNY
ncbi:MAG: beta strand repeat-containing protein, partial [Ignavibacteria bacterium]